MTQDIQKITEEIRSELSKFERGNGHLKGIGLSDTEWEQILTVLDEYPKLKESYLERVSTANKIISEKIDEIKKLKQKLDEIYPCSSGATSLSVIEVLYLYRFKVRMEDFLKTKYGLYVNDPLHTNEWKLLEEISDILKGVIS